VATPAATPSAPVAAPKPFVKSPYESEVDFRKREEESRKRASVAEVTAPPALFEPIIGTPVPSAPLVSEASKSVSKGFYKSTPTPPTPSPAVPVVTQPRPGSVQDFDPVQIIPSQGENRKSNAPNQVSPVANESSAPKAIDKKAANEALKSIERRLEEKVEE